MTVGSNDRAAQYTVEELTALVQEARRLQKTVAAHAHGTAGIRTAVAAVCNVIEHCSWISPEASNRVSYDEHVAEQMAEQGIFMDPTLTGGVRNLRRIRRPTPRQLVGRALRPYILKHTGDRSNLASRSRLVPTRAPEAKTMEDSAERAAGVPGVSLGLSTGAMSFARWHAEWGTFGAVWTMTWVRSDQVGGPTSWSFRATRLRT